MKAHTPLKSVIGLLAGALFLGGDLAQAKTVDLTELGGRFKGGWSLDLFGTPIAGTVTVKSQVKSKGSKAKITIAGLIPASPSLPFTTALPFSANVDLKAPRTAKIKNIVLGSPLPLPAITGKFKQKSSTRVTANALVVNPGGLTGTLGVKADFKVIKGGKKLKGVLAISLNGTPVATITIDAKRKGK